LVTNYFAIYFFPLRNIAVERLNTFDGIAFNNSTNLWLVWRYEARCTLREVIFNDDFNLTDQFQTSFISDLVKVG
jgi:hypothetical protein